MSLQHSVQITSRHSLFCSLQWVGKISVLSTSIGRMIGSPSSSILSIIKCDIKQDFHSKFLIHFVYQLISDFLMLITMNKNMLEYTHDVDNSVSNKLLRTGSDCHSSNTILLLPLFKYNPGIFRFQIIILPISHNHYREE